MAFYQELLPGDTLVVGNSRIQIERKTGQRVRVAIESPEHVERIKAGEPMPALTSKSTAQAQPAAPQQTAFLKRPTVSTPTA